MRRDIREGDQDAEVGHFLLKPVQMGISSCGPTLIDLVFKATDSNGMSTVAVRRVILAFRAC